MSKTYPVTEFVLPGSGEFCRVRRVSWLDMSLAVIQANKLSSMTFLIPALAQRVCTFDDGKQKTLDEMLALDIEDFIPIQNHINAQISNDNLKGA